jgi:SAM-dependent methyltransferase
LIVNDIKSFLVDWDLIQNQKFIKLILPSIKTGSKVLDAGAGDLKYKKYFKNFEYTSVDFCQVDKTYGEVDIICNLTNIPLKDETFDVILCLQVLEHVPDPRLVAKELHRLLKKGGRLLLTAPQNWGEHEEPYDFYRFTRYSLLEILKEAGFEGVDIRPKGGYFLFLGQMIILAGGVLRVKDPRVNRILRASVTLLGLLVAWPLRMLDFLDEEKKITLGYTCICNKASE